MKFLRTLFLRIRRWWGKPDTVRSSIDARQSEALRREPRASQDMSSRGGGFF